MDQTPLTLPSRSNLLLTANYFQKLGLRYVLFSDRGVLQGILTKKDVWYVLNGAEETRRTMGTDVTTGLAREDGEGEERGLLNNDGESVDTTPTSPANDVPIL
jgi:chloride channel 3/4/5